MMMTNTLQENLNKLLEQYNIRSTASILEAEIRIVLAIPTDCAVDLGDIRELIMSQLSERSLQPRKIVKIYKVFQEGAVEIQGAATTAPITQADVRREIFRMPNRSFLSPKEIRQYICQGWFTALQDL
jgi:hypothetical protein